MARQTVCAAAARRRQRRINTFSDLLPNFHLRPRRDLPKEPLTTSGPFVYRLGRQVFNLKRGVRLPYGLPLFD